MRPDTTSPIRAIDLVCPRCAARPGRACRGTRIPSPYSFGGGWGGPSNLDKPHAERYAARRAHLSTRA
jgi:hypothetical protein